MRIWRSITSRTQSRPERTARRPASETRLRTRWGCSLLLFVEIAARQGEWSAIRIARVLPRPVRPAYRHQVPGLPGRRPAARHRSALGRRAAQALGGASGRGSGESGPDVRLQPSCEARGLISSGTGVWGLTSAACPPQGGAWFVDQRRCESDPAAGSDRSTGSGRAGRPLGQLRRSRGRDEGARSRVHGAQRVECAPQLHRQIPRRLHRGTRMETDQHLGQSPQC